MVAISYTWTIGSIQRRKLTNDEVEEIIVEALTWYSKTLMKDHFRSGNVFRYGYKKLSKEYIKQKIKKYGMKPVLVASGELRESVLNTFEIEKIGRRYVISWSTPDWGKYQIEKGRDWRKPSLKEWQAVKDRIDNNLNKLRKQKP